MPLPSGAQVNLAWLARSPHPRPHDARPAQALVPSGAILRENPRRRCRFSSGRREFLVRIIVRQIRTHGVGQ
jgi:hypothetical protein